MLLIVRLEVIEIHFNAKGLHIDFSNNESYEYLNVVFVTEFIYSMLEEKFRYVDKSFQLCTIFPFFDSLTTERTANRGV